MRKMLISYKPYVYYKIKNDTKIFDYRTVFSDETILAYMYVSTPVKSITGILIWSNKEHLSEWKEKYSYDSAAVATIDEFMNHNKVVMQINNIYETNAIFLDNLRESLDEFVVL